MGLEEYSVDEARAVLNKNDELVGMLGSGSRSGQILSFADKAKRHVMVHKALGGKTTLFPLADKTGYVTCRAPGRVRKVQVVVACSQNTAAVFKGSFAVGAGYGNGCTLKNAANADLVPTALTWGTTDPNDFANPGGGAATAEITGASGAEATYNLVEGYAYSDWMTVTPVDRIDIPGAGNPVTARIYSAGAFPGSHDNRLPASPAFGANWIGAGEVEFSQGYSYGDDTGVAVPDGADLGSAYGVSVGFRFLLDAPGQSHICAGDSTMEGYGNDLLQAAGATPGNVGGYVRKVRDWQIARGVQSSLVNEARTGERATLYLRRLIPQLLRNRFTHAWIQPWTINETLAPTVAPHNIETCLDLTLQALRACEVMGTKPILVESPADGFAVAPAAYAKLAQFLDNAEASGIAVLRCPDLVHATPHVQDARYTMDGIHLNETGYQVLLRHIVESRDYYGLA